MMYKGLNILNKKQMISAALLLCAVSSVHAMPITGQLGMGGNFIAVDQTWSATGTAAATGVDFDPNMFIVTSKTGDFASVVSPFGSITDFQFDPGMGVNDGMGGVTAVASIANFWTIDGFSFELTSVAEGFTNTPDMFLVLNGTGIIRAAGFDDTLGIWEFTGDTTRNGTFTWSAVNTPAPVDVPAPGVLALLGLGLLAMSRRLQLRHTA